jgi:hypothetical protein
MKATTFVATTVPAEGFITPDPVQLTIGALVNRILDRTEDPVILIIDQRNGTKRIVGVVEDITNEDVAAATGFQALLDVLADYETAIVFTPGDEPGAPFEG